MATLKELEQRINELAPANIVDYTEQIQDIEGKLTWLIEAVRILQANSTDNLDIKIKEAIASNTQENGTVVYAPKTINIVPGIINALIDWTAVEGASQYYVYYNALGANPIKIGPTKATSLTIPRLQAGTEYEVFVRSAAGSYLSQPGAKVKFTTKTLN